MSDFMIALGLIPVAVILWFVIKNDKNPEPVSLIVGLLLLGAFGSVALTLTITGIIEGVMGDAYTTLTESFEAKDVFIRFFFTVGLVEEFSKWIMVRLKAYNHKAFDETYDGIIYAVCVSLGFAGLENILYITQFGVAVGFLRAFLSVPGHAAFAFLMGLFIGKAKKAQVNGNKNDEIFNLILSIIVPTAAHGLYDFCTGMNSRIYLYIFFALVVVINLSLFIGAIIIASKDERFSIKSDVKKDVVANVRRCPECNSVDVSTRFCVRCGHKIRE